LFLFIVFRRKKSKTDDIRNGSVDPVSLEIIEEENLLIHRDKSVTDTTNRDDFLDGENRFRGGTGYSSRGMQFFGGFNSSTEDHDKFDSDGNRE
jgi:hypothetical protein